MRVVRSCLSVVCILAIASTAAAQLPQTRLRAVFPPAAQIGSTVELKLAAGDDLEEMSALHFTHPGIAATQKMQDAGGKQTPVDNTFVVAVSGDVPPGIYEVRASGLFGVTNPVRFAVHNRPHVAEAEPNNELAQAQPVEVNRSIVGRMDSGADVDRFKFQATRGQRIVVDCLSERLDSQMDATLEVHSPDGALIARARDSRGEDPLLVLDIPADGEYVLTLHDQTYRSGAEHVYRLDIHAGPHIAFVMPPAGEAGQRSKFTLYGCNLPGGEATDLIWNRNRLERLDVEIDVPATSSSAPVQNVIRSYEADVDFFSYRLQGESGVSNPVRIGIARSAPVFETEPNNEPVAATALTAPGEAAGQFASPGDIDWYAFPAKQGEAYAIEVVGQRLGTTLDPVLIVEEVTKNAEGAEQVKRLTTQDDDGANVAPNVFDTFTDDPAFRVSAGQDATYRVGVYDRYGQTRGGPHLRYRLCVRKDEPDFRVVAAPVEPQNNSGVPAPPTLRRGSSFGVNVYALRKSGFDGPIDIRAEGLPAGVTCEGGTIGAKENVGQLVFRAAEDAPAAVTEVKLTAVARSGDQEIQRPVASGTLMNFGQANVAAEGRLAQSFALAVIEEPAPFETRAETPRTTVCQSRQILVPVQLARRSGFDDKVTLTVAGLPKSSNIEAANLTIEKGQDQGLLRVLVKDNAPPATYAFWLSAQGQVNYSRNPAKTERAKQEQAEAAKQLAAAQEQSKQATEAKNKAAQAANDASTKLQQAATAKQQADQAVQKQTDELAQTQQKHEASIKQGAALQAAHQAAEKSLADAQAALGQDSENADLKAKVEAAAQAVADAKQAFDQTTAEQAALAQNVAAAETALTQAKQVQDLAAAAVKQAEEQKAAADKAKAESEAAEQAAQAAVKPAEQAKQEADKRVAAAEQQSKPQNKSYTAPLGPIVIDVQPAPVKLTASVPNGGAVKRGESIEIKVKVERLNGFEGPVSFTLPLPPGVTGLGGSAELPADQTEATIQVAAAADATEGQLANMVIRATVDRNGEQIVDAPVALKVNP